jgi:4'-phosphopantetheinyl transferase
MFQAVEWELRRSPPLLRDNEIHIWRCHLGIDASTRVRFFSYLSADERQRAERFHFERDRDRYVSARGALRAILSRYLDVQPADLHFDYGDRNKPRLAREFCGKVFGFNLSHSSDLAIYAVGWNRNIGIDVERIRTNLQVEDIAPNYFSPSELHSLMSVPSELRAESFFACWTRKEAYIKARGEGLDIPLASFDVTLRPGRAAGVISENHSSWQMVGFLAELGYPAALVYDGSPVDLRFLTLDPS